MLRLLNYEIQRKWKMTIGILIGYFIIYFGMIIKFKSTGGLSLDEMPFQLLFFILLASGLFLGAIIGAINNMRIEVKQNTRDLYFSVPITAYTKVGSKVIVSFVETGFAFIIGGYSCVKALEQLSGVSLWKPFMNEVMKTPLNQLVLAASLQILTMLMSIVIVYLSFAIFRSFFSQIKFGGLITLGIYIGINYIIVRYVNPAMGISLDHFNDVDIWFILIKSTLLCLGLFGLTGYLFEKRVSFD